MSFDFPQPLRLAVGLNRPGSGRGCAMQVISYENGDKEISDYPPCADRLLTQMVQNVNDTFCKERDEGLLCAECSVKVLELAHRTVGTALDDWDSVDRDSLYRTLAMEFTGTADWEWNLVESFYDSDFLRISEGLPVRSIEDAHRLIDKFEELTGIKAKPVPVEVTKQAVSKMREKVDA